MKQTKQGSGVFFGHRCLHWGKCIPKKTPDPVHARHAGVVLIAVLVALLVVMLISATIVRGLVVQHRLATAEPVRVQAFWLAESAVQRARTQLEASADYAGETWQIEVSIGGSATGQAVIRVEPIENEPNKRTIIVESRFPNDPIGGKLEARSIVVELDRPAEES
jgi:Tfp pilus assembly protein PilV